MQLPHPSGADSSGAGPSGPGPVPSGIVTLLTDFGLDDHYVGVMKGVLLGIFPAAKIVDITHGVQEYSVAQGAFYLDQAHRYFPAGSVHVAVVDPGVGGPRRALAATARGHYFIAPDNGLLSRVLEHEPGAEVREIDAERWSLKPLSRTFHGRDLFAPAAAWLASGKAFEGMGVALDAPVRLWPAEPREQSPGHWRGVVLNIDRFGNIVTSFKPETIAGCAFRLRVGTIDTRQAVDTFAEAQGVSPVLILGSSGYLEMSIRRGSAAGKAGAEIGDDVDLTLE